MRRGTLQSFPACSRQLELNELLFFPRFNYDTFSHPIISLGALGQHEETLRAHTHHGRLLFFLFTIVDYDCYVLFIYSAKAVSRNFVLNVRA